MLKLEPPAFAPAVPTCVFDAAGNGDVAAGSGTSSALESMPRSLRLDGPGIVGGQIPELAGIVEARHSYQGTRAQ